jgi:hypothetical protein
MTRAARDTALPTLWQLAAVETDDCVLWPFGTSSGYGIINFWNVGGLPRRTHVLVCERYHGPRPDDRPFTLHSCREKRCVNPRHLRWGTALENMRDQYADGTRVMGERHPAWKGGGRH